jgi:two-component system, sensor histidine kinase PdtaS
LKLFVKNRIPIYNPISWIWLTVLCIVVCTSNAQTNEFQLKQLLKNTKQDSTAARLQGELAWLLKFSNPTESLQFANAELSYGYQYKNALRLADAYRIKGLLYVVDKKYAEGIAFYDSCMYYAKSCNSEYYQASCLSLKAGMYGVFGDYEKSIETYEQGLLHAKKATDPRMLAVLSNNLSAAYKQSGTNKKAAQELLLISKKNFITINDYKNAAATMANIAQEFADEKNEAKAIAELNESISFLHKDTTDIQMKGVIYNTYASIYLDVHKIDSAKKYAHLSEKILDKLNVPDNLNDTYETLTKIYMAENNLLEAQKYAEKTLALGKLQSRKISISKAYENLAIIAENNNNAALALTYYKLHKAWSDSVFNAQREESLNNQEIKIKLAQQEFETTLETKKKQQENKELAVTNSRLTWLTILATLAGLALAFLSYLLWKSNKKKVQINQQLLAEKNIVEQQSKEKQILIGEIHHRVKNNLTMLKSLLFLQSRTTKQDETKRILEEAQARVSSMALVHKNLYDDNDTGKLNLPIFVENLLSELAISYRDKANEIAIQVTGICSELDIDIAIPLALILNELATNSFKYAFDGIYNPLISIRVSQSKNEVHIQYADNGIGLPANFDLQAGGFGFKVLHILIKQIKASIQYHKSSTQSVFEIVVPV